MMLGASLDDRGVSQASAWDTGGTLAATDTQAILYKKTLPGDITVELLDLKLNCYCLEIVA